MRLDEISAYILTFNEQDNIAKCLDALNWAKEVFVIDSYSDDSTLEIARKYSNVRVIQRAFDSHSNQHNFALDQIQTSKWVLRLDADWLVTERLLSELQTADFSVAVGGLKIPFEFSIYGEIVPISLYPPVIALFKREGVRYIQDGHTERLVPNGEVLDCPVCLIHEDNKSVDRFLQSQMQYSKLELGKLSKTEGVHENWKTKIRSRPGLAPILMAFFLLVLKGGAFRGRAAWHYTLQKIIAECTVSLRVLDEKMRKGSD